MAKKKPRRERDPEPPKFAGWKPLEGLRELRAKVAAETKEPRATTAKVRDSSPSVKATSSPPQRGAPRSSTSDRARTPHVGGSSEGTQVDDSLSFHRLMAGVEPIAHDRVRVPLGASDIPRAVGDRSSLEEIRQQARADAEHVVEHLHRLVDDAVRFEVTDDGARVEGWRIDSPPSLVRALRRGQLPVDATLDLHGMSAHTALDELVAFLRAKRSRGERCVLVIHGKGERIAGAGVLRGEIAAWLSQGRAREHVAAFASAREADGGRGALYVALRR